MAVDIHETQQTFSYAESRVLYVYEWNDCEKGGMEGANERKGGDEEGQLDL